MDSSLDADTPLTNQLKSLKSEIESELQDEEDSDSNTPEVKIHLINAGGDQNMAPLSAEQIKMIKNHLTSMAKPESKEKGEQAENQHKTHADIYNQLGWFYYFQVKVPFFKVQICCSFAKKFVIFRQKWLTSCCR